MTTRETGFWTLASVALLLMPSAASSQTHADASAQAPSQTQIEVTPYFGYGADMTSMMGGWGVGYPAPHAGTGPVFGGRFAYRVRPQLLVEATAGYTQPTHMFDGYGYEHMGYVVPGAGSAVVSASSLAYEGNLLYEFRVSRWAPYVTAGLGAFTTWPDGGSAWTDPAGNFGIGFKFSPRGPGPRPSETARVPTRRRSAGPIPSLQCARAASRGDGAVRPGSEGDPCGGKDDYVTTGQRRVMWR